MWQEQLASCDIAEHFEIKFLASVLLRCAPELDFSGVAGKEGVATFVADSEPPSPRTVAAANANLEAPATVANQAAGLSEIRVLDNTVNAEQ